MTTMRAITLGSLTVLSLAAFTSSSTSSFSGLVSGSLRSEMHGDATFGVVDGRGIAPSVFTLSLGANGTDGSILITRTNGMRLVPGTYTITGREDGSDELRALVMTGSAEHPTGVFRGESGTLTITSVTDNVIRGTYRLNGTGFVASDPADEHRQIVASGGFSASRD
jgi:hypothetical protein